MDSMSREDTTTWMWEGRVTPGAVTEESEAMMSRDAYREVSGRAKQEPEPREVRNNYLSLLTLEP
jgi:hypothetical protein